MRHLAFVVLVAAVAAPVAFAGHERPVTGMWHGKLRFDMNNLPRVVDKHQNATRSKFLQELEQSTLTLTLRADHTYALMVVIPSKGTSRFSGRWSRDRSAITIEQIVNGRYSGKPQVFTLDKNEKSMSLANFNAGVKSTVSYFR